MVEPLKKAMAGWSLSKEVSLSTMFTIMLFGFAGLWAAKDKVDTIRQNEIKPAQIETGYVLADADLTVINQSKFVEVNAAIRGLQDESQQRAITLQKILTTQEFILEAVEDISGKVDP